MYHVFVQNNDLQRAVRLGVSSADETPATSASTLNIP